MDIAAFLSSFLLRFFSTQLRSRLPITSPHPQSAYVRTTATLPFYVPSTASFETARAHYANVARAGAGPTTTAAERTTRWGLLKQEQEIFFPDL